jgi:hypothetical protein
MNRLGMNRRSLTLTAFFIAGLSLGMNPASAQVPTPPPIPPLPYVTPPEAAQPVFELIAPTIYPQCGTAALGVFLAGTSAPQIAPQLQGASTPVFVICGSVPRPQEQLTCLLDLQAQEAVNAVTSQAGAALPLGLHPEGDAVEQTIIVVDKLPPPASSSGLQAISKRVLVCAASVQAPVTGGDYSMGPPAFAPAPYVPGSVAPGTIPNYFPQQPVTQLPPVLTAPANPTRPVGDAVIYAIVWLLPLGLLMFGGYFGTALTRDVTLPPVSV